MPSETPSIVVVEDDASMSQAIKRILRAGGFMVDTFSSAEDALEGTAASTADCLILDIHLPGISGFEMYRQLFRSGQGIPAIFITGHDQPAARQEAETLAGKSGYLLKPFSGEELLNAVQHALRD
jgi:FixJ family two-component response regulator